MEIVFWGSVSAVLYPYVGYPVALWAFSALRGRRAETLEAGDLPSVSMIIPVHNEASRIERKIANTAALQYPAERLQVLFVSDGSTDRTVEIIRAQAPPAMTVVELPTRRGKAAGLNAGLDRAGTRSSCSPTPPSSSNRIRSRRCPEVSRSSHRLRVGRGSDRRIGGEAWYGRYELLLRRLESEVGSIVGASGSFYAQRRSICRPFVEGLAPDFLSVLRTVEQGYRAVSDPFAVGAMTSVKDPQG